jgi:AhpD family alkylhydroperoxidase
MREFLVPGRDQVAAAAQATFDSLQKMMGKVPNLYATIGYSANALNSYLTFVQAQAKGSFHAKEREAIYLMVSQLNGCPYCLAAHTVSAMRNGWTEEETLLLRSGQISDARWIVLYKLIQSVIEHKGEVEENILNEFFKLGYTEGALMDLMALISIMSFTNYVYRLIRVPIDYPLSKPTV